MDIARGTNRPLQVMMEAMHSAIGENPLMAYLAMMAVRLVELHRVLKDTGSLYLHCDPTASHYLKLVLDAVFGAENFETRLFGSGQRPKGYAFARLRLSARYDLLLFKGSIQFTWNRQYRPIRRGVLSRAIYPHRRRERADDTG